MPSHPRDTPAVPSRERLLDAAKRLFAAQGYEQSATSAIAREAGTSESQLMRYFGGKAGLLDALFEAAWKRLNTRIQLAVEGAPDRRAALVAGLQALVASLARDQPLATLLLFEGHRLRGDAPRVTVARGWVRFAETLRGLVRDAQASRELDPALDPSAVTAALLGATEAMMRDRLLARTGHGRSFPEREIRRTLAAMLDGFTASAGEESARAAGRTRTARR